MVHKLLSRIAAILAFSLWWGGLTFYGTVVVPIGAQVLGGETEQGFITQQVSHYINVLGVGTLVALLWSAAISWRDTGKTTKIILSSTWIAMFVAQVVLLVMHPKLDAMLDVKSRGIAEPMRFHAIHEFYLTVTGVQWFAGLLYLVLAMTSWQTKSMNVDHKA